MDRGHGTSARTARAWARTAALVLVLAWAGASFADPKEDLSAELARATALLDQPARHAEAETALRNVVRKAFEAGDTESEVGALRGLTQLYYGRSEYVPLLDVLDALLEAHRRQGDAAAIAAAEFDRGAVLAMAGQARAALAPLQRAEAEFLRLGNRGGAARAQVELAGVFTQLGQLERARSHAHAARTTYEGLSDLLGAAEAESQLGGVYRQIGDYARALRSYEVLRDHLEKSGDRRAWMDARADVGAALHELGQFEASRKIFKEIIAYYAKAGDTPAEARARVYLARVHVRSGDHEAAKHVLEAVFSVAKDVPLVMGYAHKSMGDALLGLRRFDDAQREYGLAQRRGEDTRAPDLVLEAGQGLARAQLDGGSASQAMQTVKRVALVADDLMGRLGDLDRVTYRRSRSGLFETGLRAALAEGRLADIAWFLELGRGSALQAGLGARATLGGKVSEAARAAVANSRKALAGARLKLASIDATNRGAWERGRVAVRAAEEAYRTAWKKLQDEAYGGLSEAYTEVTTLRQMSLSLRPGEAFALYGMLPDRAVAVVLEGRFKKPRLVTLHIEAIRKVSQAMRPRAAAGRGLVLPDATPQGEETLALADAAEVLLDVLELDPKVQRLYVSPQGALATLPWTAMAGASKRKPIVVALIPSVGTYRLIAEDRALRGAGVLGLGDPVYKAGARSGTRGLYGAWALPRLEATRPEVIRATRHKSSVRLLGKEATKANLLAELARRTHAKGRFRSVHLACHGLVNADDPLRSALAFTPASEHDDGLLTASEIFDTPFATDLVVLSACDTGLGRVASAEGLRGFARAFLMAGAPRVLVSLWPVDDEATAALMGHFYDRLDQGDAPARALRASQRWMQKATKWKAPRFWAAWVLWGLAD